MIASSPAVAAADAIATANVCKRLRGFNVALAFSVPATLS